MLWEVKQSRCLSNSHISMCENLSSRSGSDAFGQSLCVQGFDMPPEWFETRGSREDLIYAPNLERRQNVGLTQPERTTSFRHCLTTDKVAQPLECGSLIFFYRGC